MDRPKEYLTVINAGTSEVIEKRSRFIGDIRPVGTEQEAQDMLAQIRRTYHDASHTCFAYILREGGITRFSDAGEPQGTAGLPILNVLQREGVTNVCCAVTRYFGGVLLGAGGLTRAYGRTAKEALDAAGVAVMRVWRRHRLSFDYRYLEQLRLGLASFDGLEENAKYAVDVTLTVLLPDIAVSGFLESARELTAGRILIEDAGTAFRGQLVK